MAFNGFLDLKPLGSRRESVWLPITPDYRCSGVALPVRRYPELLQRPRFAGGVPRRPSDVSGFSSESAVGTFVGTQSLCGIILVCAHDCEAIERTVSVR